MGTSSSYKGSSGKLPRALRDGFTDWADAGPDAGNPKPPDGLVGGALNIPSFPRRPSGPGSAGGTGGGASSGGSGSGSPRRNIRTYASTAGRAAAVARAFRDGDRSALEREGFDFDELSRLPSRAEMARRIVDVVCAAQTSSDIESEEQRDIAVKLVDWTLDSVLNPAPPSAADIAQYSIGLIAAEIFISEMGDELRARSGRSREDLIDRIYETAEADAARAEIGRTATTGEAITKAIESGVRRLRRIYRQREET